MVKYGCGDAADVALVLLIIDSKTTGAREGEGVSSVGGLPGRESLVKSQFLVRAVTVNNGNERSEETLGALVACILRAVLLAGVRAG